MHLAGTVEGIRVKADMSDQAGDVLDFLRAQFARVHDKLEAMSADLAEVKQRLTTVEIQVSSLAATEGSHYGHTMQRLDRLESRLGRIERRFDLADVPIS